MARIIAQRELRNDNAKVIEAVAKGETFIVTRNGVPVAELRPVTAGRQTFVPAATLRRLAEQTPSINADDFFSDLDRWIDQDL